jgi:tRNA threonylcarbamoyladenosine biosynthesis protein TsaB
MNHRIVAIETSGRHGSVVVACGSDILAERELPPPMRHAAELMPAVRDLVRAAGWRPHEIEHLYVSLGPGSFTGLRIAVAAVRAMAQAIVAGGGACQIVGVPSLDVIAENAPAEFPVVVPVLDAKRGQVFAARYERGADGALARAIEAGLVDPAGFLRDALARAEEMAAAPQSKIDNRQSKIASVAVLGEGVDYHRAALLSAGVGVVELDKSLWPGRARTVHRLGYAMAQRGTFTPLEALLPLYIRLPEAEEVYRRRHATATIGATPMPH